MKTIATLASTLFYIGKIPFMPGTKGSLFAVIIWYFIPNDLFIQVPLIAVTFAIGMWSSRFMINETEENDPSCVVIDELVGMWIALLYAPHRPLLIITAFVLFRIFDIFKPSIINDSQKLQGAWGIMVDDVLAGVFAWCMVMGISTIC